MSDKYDLYLFDPEVKSKRLLSSSLLQRGILLRTLKNKNEILSISKATDKSIFVCYLKKNDFDLIDILKTLAKEQQEKKNVIIVLFLSENDSAFLSLMAKYGLVDHFIKTPNFEPFIRQLAILCKKYTISLSIRSKIQVSPAKGDVTLLKFSYPVSQSFGSGKLISMTFSGLIFQVKAHKLNSELAPNVLLKSITLQIGRMELNFMGVIINAKENLFVIKFYQLNDYNKNMIGNYIYDILNTQENLEEIKKEVSSDVSEPPKEKIEKVPEKKVKGLSLDEEGNVRKF